MSIEEWLSILEQRFRAEIALIAAGLEGPDRRSVMAGIRDAIVLELADRELPERELLAEAERLFLGELLARGLSLPASVLARARYPRHSRGLNAEEAVCLWLGFLRPQTFGLAGLWQLYLDLDPTVPLPEVIHQVFAPRGQEGENQEFIAQVLSQARRYGLPLTDGDTSKIIAWVVETHPRLRGRDPDQVVQELKSRKSKAVTSVDQNLLRGGNTLMDGLVRHAFRAVENGRRRGSLSSG